MPQQSQRTSIQSDEYNVDILEKFAHLHLKVTLVQSIPLKWDGLHSNLIHCADNLDAQKIWRCRAILAGGYLSALFDLPRPEM